MAVQQIGRAATNEGRLPVFYVPPPQGPNIMAAAVSGFLQTRLPWAQALFEERLKAMDPGPLQERLAELAKTRQALLADAVRLERQAMESAGITAAELLRGFAIEQQALSEVASQREQTRRSFIEAEAGAREAAILPEEVQQDLADLAFTGEGGGQDTATWLRSVRSLYTKHGAKLTQAQKGKLSAQLRDRGRAAGIDEKMLDTALGKTFGAPSGPDQPLESVVPPASGFTRGEIGNLATKTLLGGDIGGSESQIRQVLSGRAPSEIRVPGALQAELDRIDRYSDLFVKQFEDRKAALGGFNEPLVRKEPRSMAALDEAQVDPEKRSQLIDFMLGTKAAVAERGARTRRKDVKEAIESEPTTSSKWPMVLPEGRRRESGPVVQAGDTAGPTDKWAGYAGLPHVSPMRPGARRPADVGITDAAPPFRVNYDDPIPQEEMDVEGSEQDVKAALDALNTGDTSALSKRQQTIARLLGRGTVRGRDKKPRPIGE